MATTTQTPADAVGAAEHPSHALVDYLAQELAADGFEIVDTKTRALLVKADGAELMIGVAEPRRDTLDPAASSGWRIGRMPDDGSSAPEPLDDRSHT